MLKTVIENLDGVDDAIKSLYAEADGIFVLNIEGIDQHPDVKNLKSAYEVVKQDKTKLAQERDALTEKVKVLPEDFDADEWSKRNEKPDLDVEAKAKLVKLRKELEEERDAAKAETEQVRQEMNGKLSQFAIERDLGDALLKANITNNAFKNGATALISPKVKADEDGKAFVDTDMGPVPLSEYVTKWAAGDGKDYVTAPKGSNLPGNDSAGNGNSKPRDEMSSVEKAEYLNEHGQESYLNLPKSKKDN